MDHGLATELGRLREDFRARTGQPFQHFFCPILFRDEDAPLCRAHVVNTAFGDSSRRWTVQRKDVDNFFGSVAEADFVGLRHAQPGLSGKALIDPELRRTFRPRFQFKGLEVEHYVARGDVPPSFTPIVFQNGDATTKLVLKMAPSDVAASTDGDWEIEVARDLTRYAIVSVIKASHLTLFAMLGYTYALSRAGMHVGRVLGAYFLRATKRSRKPDLGRLADYFAPLVRPVVSNPLNLRGTIDDGWVQLAWLENTDPPRPWAMIVFVRTANHLHAALMPTFDDAAGAERFALFCRRGEDSLSTSLLQFRDNCWHGSPARVSTPWPAATPPDTDEK